ncbi:MAG: SRPBCC domain-containing protein [Abditibacteriales bacterium]|nr:SRPBCC domain-containing protein [Abditibacteriales bacterium]
MPEQPIKVQQQFTVPAPIESVWSFLRDVNSFASCIPDVQQVEAVDERTFNAVVKVHILTMKAEFQVTATIVEETPPTHLVSELRGADAEHGGTIALRNVLDLRSLPGGETEVSYVVDGTLSGTLAALGGGMAVKLKAMQMGKAFAAEVRRRVVMVNGRGIFPP